MVLNDAVVYSLYYETIVRWEVISDPFLGNNFVNTFLRQRLRMQQVKHNGVHAVRAENWGTKVSSVPDVFTEAEE
jgi:hypothetical protein